MKKLVIISSVSAAVTFGLFAFMAFLISSDKVVVTTPPDEIQVVIMSLPDEKPPVVRVRPIFEPPVTPPPVPSPQVPTSGGDTNTTLTYQLPDVNLPTGGTDPFTLGKNIDSDARPVVRVTPKYPLTASRDGIEGWVVLGFDINTIGEVVNISIIDSEPKRVFDKAARQALKKWKYKAKSIDGKAVVQQSLTVQLDFTMSKST